MKTIASPHISKSNGHYAQCIEHNGILYLSGQLPLDGTTNKIPPTIEQQTNVALANIEKILTCAGSGKDCIIQVRIYLSDIGLWDKVDAAYARFFQNHKPVRSVIPTGVLHFGSLIEIEATAILKS